MAIDRQLNERVLQHIKWQHGILPSGRISSHKCFVLQAMPVIKLLVDKERRPATLLVTQSEWTANLVDSAALCNLYDDATLQALAECAAIFHPPEKPKDETFHLLYYDTHAYFRVSDILQPTAKFQQALDPVLERWPKDPTRAWQGLCRVWNEFGFLWPQKIMLGLRHHLKQVYSISNPNPNRLNELRQAQACDEASAQLEDICARRIAQEGPRQQQQQQQQQLKSVALTWTIIHRSDLQPVHRFLPAAQRDMVTEMINSFVHRIPRNQPVRLCSLSTGGYLSWRPPHHAAKATAPVLFATCPMGAMTATQSRYLWRLDPDTYAAAYIRCGSRVYLHPAACGTRHGSTKVLTRARVPHSPSNSSSSPAHEPHHHKPAERLRSLELVEPDSEDDRHWTVEMDHMGLEHEDDLAADTSRNVDVAIGRRRPVLHGDTVALRQVHYLCSLASPSASGSSPLSRSTVPAAAITSPSVTNSSTSLGSSQQQQQQCSTANTSVTNNTPHGGGGSAVLRSVLAKEIGIIQGTAEHLWTIEIASPQDLHYHYGPDKERTKQPLQQQPLTAEALKREAPLTDLGRQLQAYSDGFERVADARPVTDAAAGVPSEATWIRPAPVRENPTTTNEQGHSGGGDDDDDDDWDVCASSSAEPFIRLYASKQHTKTVSHLVKAGSLVHLGKHFTH